MKFSLFRMSAFLLTGLLSVSLCDARGPGGGGGKGGGGGGGQSPGGAQVGGGGKAGPGNGGNRVGGGGQGQGGVQVPGGQGQGGGRGQGGIQVPGGGRVLGGSGLGQPRTPNSPRINVPGTNLPGTNLPGANQPGNNLPGNVGTLPNNGPRNFPPRNNGGNNLPANGNNAGNDGRPPRSDGNFNGGVNAHRDGNGNGQRYAHQTFHNGYWNQPHANHNFNNRNFNNSNNGAYQGARAYSRLNGGLGPNGYGANAYGYGSRGGYGNSGGGNGLGTLLGIGLALAGYGNGFGLGSGYGGGIGGYGQGYGLGGYGGYGLYGGYPIGWGLGGGGLGGLAYNSGYLPYSNPYYASNMGGYNYAQPIPTAVVANENPNASQLFDTALAQFKAGDYQGALISVDNSIQQNPSDPTVHEFRALTLFALKNYDSAAATIHSVLAVGPGWNWDTVSNLYADTDVYESQLRALEQETEAKPGQAGTHFLLAYHYMVTGHPDAASRQLTRVVKAAPNDRLAADLLKMNDASSTAATEPAQAAPTAAPAQPAGKSIDPSSLVGTWHATREDGSKFDLQLTDDKTFTWKVVQQGREQSITGKYEVQKDLLALETPDAGGMVAQVAQNDDGRFTFKMLGAPQDDKGLAFSK